MTIAYVGLGSNLAEPRKQIETALLALSGLPRTTLRTHSRLYATEPWGRSDQPAFVNAVAELDTQLSARDFLDALLAVERQAGRERNSERWGPRILDLDVLLYGQARIDEPALHVPHPRLHERAFVAGSASRNRAATRRAGPRPGDRIARADRCRHLPRT